MKKKIKPYAARIEPWYSCSSSSRCSEKATWRINTVGIDGDGVNLCDSHADSVLNEFPNLREEWNERRKELRRKYGEKYVK